MNDLDFQEKDVRNAQLANFTQEDSLKALNKAKSLVMAYWHGETIATTKQVASFYSIDEDVLRKILVRQRDEFYSDGARKIEGQELQDARAILSLASATSVATIWTPRAILRAGMLLRDSLVAKQVRAMLLDLVSANPSPKQLGLDPWDLTDEQAGQVFAMAFPQMSCDEQTQPPTLIAIAEVIELVMTQASVSRKVIAMATADAIAQAYPELSATMSIAQKYLQL